MTKRSRLYQANEFKPGDIIAFSGNAWSSAAINLATWGIPWWSISHVGIVAHGGASHGQLLFESVSGKAVPCEITGQVIDGTQAHSLESVVNGYDGKVWHYPLYRQLFAHEDKRLTDFLLSTVGVPYDRLGAFRAGYTLFSWVESQIHEEDLTKLFCSEWCAAAHAVMGLLPSDNAGRWNPNYLCRYERRMGLLRKPRRLK